MTIQGTTYPPPNCHTWTIITEMTDLWKPKLYPTHEINLDSGKVFMVHMETGMLDAFSLIIFYGSQKATLLLGVL